MLLSLFDDIADSMKLTPHTTDLPRSIDDIHHILATDSFELHLITRLLLQWTQLSVHITIPVVVRIERANPV